MDAGRIQIVVHEGKPTKPLGCVFSIAKDSWAYESWRPQDKGRTQDCYRNAGAALNGLLDWFGKD